MKRLFASVLMASLMAATVGLAGFSHAESAKPAFMTKPHLTPQQKHDMWVNMTPEQRQAKKAEMHAQHQEYRAWAKDHPEEAKQFHEQKRAEYKAWADANPEQAAKLREAKREHYQQWAKEHPDKAQKFQERREHRRDIRQQQRAN